MSYMSLYAILSLSDIPPPWETKYTLVTINTHGTFRTYHVCMQRQIKMQLAIATIYTSQCDRYMVPLSTYKVNLTVIVHYFLHEQGVNKHSLQ